MNSFDLTIEYKAIPKKRWRIGKDRRCYNPVEKEENELSWRIKAAILEKNIEVPILCDLYCDIDIIGDFWTYKEKKRDKVTEIKRKKRGDKDNYEKFILDSMKKAGIFKDDRQVVGGDTKLHQHPINKYILISLSPAVFSCCNDIPLSKMSQGYECLICKKRFIGEVLGHEG